MHDPPRILVVDDNETNRDILVTRLEAHGYQTLQAADGEEALRGVAQHSPDLVLLDLKLPDGSGHDVLEEVRSDPQTRLLPVVVLTGFATAEEKIRATRAGVSDFLSKPFQAEELLPRAAMSRVLTSP